MFATLFLLSCEKENELYFTGETSGGEGQIDIVKTGGNRYYLTLPKFEYKNIVEDYSHVKLIIKMQQGVLIEEMNLIPNAKSERLELPSLPLGEYKIIIKSDTLYIEKLIIIN